MHVVIVLTRPHGPVSSSFLSSQPASSTRRIRGGSSRASRTSDTRTISTSRCPRGASAFGRNTSWASDPLLHALAIDAVDPVGSHAIRRDLLDTEELVDDLDPPMDRAPAHVLIPHELVDRRPEPQLAEDPDELLHDAETPFLPALLDSATDLVDPFNHRLTLPSCPTRTSTARPCSGTCRSPSGPRPARRP